MENACCFSGHRTIPPERLDRVKNKTAEAIHLLYSVGVRTFKAGGALGYDTLAALLVLEFKKTHPDVRLELELISPDQERSWSEPDKELFNSIKEAADSIRYASQTYSRPAIFARNRNLVDGSAHCVCFLDKETGGTAYTVKHARGRGLEIINTAIL